jgi:adenosyl cobinamide kinase/adenosyl cobinamide phosphate guanylyltransferase
MIILVLGGARSGKSAVAESRAAALPSPILYFATAKVDGDDEMTARVAAHRERRPEEWTTIEAGEGLVDALRANPEGTALVDALGPWVAHHRDFNVDAREFLEALAERSGDAVVVSEEVGLGVHPSTAAGRAFRDALGDLNRAVADAADQVLLVIAGRVVPL